MESAWINTAHQPNFESLKGDRKTDVLIIGGGITGILCAYALQQAGVDYLLAEAGKICGGITRNTTAKITLQHGLIYDKIINKYGAEKAQMYLNAQDLALEKLSELCSNIDCDFVSRDSFVYSLSDREKIEREVAAFNKLGKDAEFCEKTELPFEIAGAVRVKNQAQFNPLKFLFSIAQGLNIYENTKILELKPDCAVTEFGKIKAKKIIIATHFPFINKHGAYFLKMYQHRSYVLALENAQTLDGMYVDECDRGLSFRNYCDMLLLGGGGHRTGKKGGNWAELKEFAKKYYPKANEVCCWATQDCMTLDGIPYIGQYSADTPNLYVATGFNKWGMTSAFVSAMILSDAMQEKRNKFSAVFIPNRSIIHPKLAVNAFDAAINILTPTKPRCPHLGCALKYNKQEHSWDCPCHGSRFTKDGRLIDNPATDDLKI